MGWTNSVAKPGATSAGIQDDVFKSAALDPHRTRAKKQAYRLIDDTLIYYQALSYYFSCMSTPPPVALTATPCCVEETRTITPA
jgi:hypothetical protein